MKDFSVGSALALLIFMVGLALLGGVGVMAYSVGQTWTPANTDAIIGGLIAACTGTLVIVAVLGMLIGGIYTIYKLRERQVMMPPSYRALPGQGQGQLANPGMPMIEMRNNETSGAWEDSGAVVDMWED